MTTQPTFDHDVVDANTIETTPPKYPFAQWLNGQIALKALGGVAYTGGLAIPKRSLGDVTELPGFMATTLTFRSGKDEPAFAADKATLAVIRTRFSWKSGHNSHTLYAPRQAYVPNMGMRGHLQALAVVQGASQPLAITFSGKASQCFEQLLRDFDQHVVQAANQLSSTGQRLPRFAFWLTVETGNHQKANASFESIITPPVLVLPPDISRETLLHGYVGRANLERFTELYHQAEAWAKAWEVGMKPTHTMLQRS